MKVDLAKAFAYPTQEAGAWVKLVVLTLLSIPFPLYMGYLVDVQKEVAEGNDEKMPNIDDFMGFFFRGLKLFFIVCIFAVPPITMLCMSFGAGLVGMLTSAHAGGNLAGAASGVGLGLVGLFATGIVMMVLWIILPMCTLRYATTGSIGAAFDFGGVLSDMGRGPLDYAVILLTMPVVHQVLSWILAFIPLGQLLIWPFSVYLAVVMANLMGQYARIYLSGRTEAPASEL